MAAWSLASADDHDTVTQALVATMRSDASEPVRATAAWAIGSLGSDAATTALAAALSDTSRDVRMRVVWALGNVEPSRGRCRRTECIEHLAPENAAPPALVAMLKDPDEETRRLVAWSLYQIEDPSALPALVAALHAETDEETQLAYLRAIAVMGDKSVDAIRGLLESPDPRVRSSAVRALAGGHATGPWPWPWPEPRPEP
jgi:HEAT repeat protein